jgi:hypothetical protein
MICIVETKVKEENVTKVKNALFPDWQILHNCDSHWMGRIWVCWDPNVASIQGVSSHEQVLSCRVDLKFLMMDMVLGFSQWCMVRIRAWIEEG